jgi:hypothetical protein
MADEFKPNVGKPVSKKVAEEGIKKFDKKFRPHKYDTKSLFFGKDAILKMLDDVPSTGITGITFFLTYQENPSVDNHETIQLVMVGTKEDGTLVWEEAQSTSVQAKSLLDGEGGGSFGGPMSCPPYCPK